MHSPHKPLASASGPMPMIVVSRKDCQQRYRQRFLVCWLLLLALPTVVHAQFTFTTNNGTITITGYTGPGGAVTIPSMITGLPVTRIGTYAFFHNGNITSLTIPPGTVTNIGGYAFFQSSSLRRITLFSGATI